MTGIAFVVASRIQDRFARRIHSSNYEHEHQALYWSAWVLFRARRVLRPDHGQEHCVRPDRFPVPECAII